MRLYPCVISLLFVLCSIIPSYALNSISIVANEQLLQNTITFKTIDDCIILLRKACDCEVLPNDPSKEIVLRLPQIEVDTTATATVSKEGISHLYYPNHDYTWRSHREGDQIILELEATTFEGVSYGLYGLLQEQLWFSFYHPQQMNIPNLTFWPLTEEFVWEAQARFDKKGFHLHTMHPLELTEPLLNPDFPNGIKIIRTYINWLVRNQQNYFEFNLLETEDLEKWVKYIRPAVRYAQSRGIKVGVDISLHMTQQKAFMLYKAFPASFKSKKKQIADNLATLFLADWDVIAMEFSTTEFTTGNVKAKQELQLYITDLVANTYGAKLTGRSHVVQQENTLGKTQKDLSLTEEQAALDQERGIFIHTVMFYGLNDQKAPVYENENLLHMLEQLKEAQKERETWYYPESAYWITFDNSVPMLLMPYLQTRLDDILLMDSLGVEGHLTFSSGWEWGYWLIDWSIARWSWRHRFNGNWRRPTPMRFVAELLKNPDAVAAINQLTELQQTYIKDKELIRYLTAQTVTDELPKPLNLEFHPRPTNSYKWLLRKANDDELKILENTVLQTLDTFIQQSEAPLATLAKAYAFPTTEDLEGRFPDNDQENAVGNELYDALKITQLRAQHKLSMLRYLVALRRQKINKNTPADSSYLHQAQQIRQAALQIVEKREQAYRYPLDLIARKIEGGGQTSYDFGYLYPVSNLHFWEREEQQIQKNNFSPFFMNIWDIPRILGIVD